MSSLNSIALSGLNDASLRASVAGRNIAVQGAKGSDGKPAKADAVVSSARASGGVASKVVATSSAPDMAGDAVDLMQARVSYAANAAVVKTNRELDHALFDSFA